MAVEMAAMEAAIGLSVPVFRFVPCFVANIPVSLLWRLVPGVHARHLYAALSEVVLSYVAFGASSNLHFFIPMAMGYSSMFLFRRYVGVITFFAGFAYLIGWLVLEPNGYSGDALKEGGIDATGALMVLTLKVISCAMNYSDGLLKDESLRLVFEMKDYLKWTERRGIWSSHDSPLPSPVLSFKDTLASYQSVYFVGTIVPIVVILLGYIIKPTRPVRSETQKTQ